MGAIKWIGGVIGWATGGILGSIIGYTVGSLIDGAVNKTPSQGSDSYAGEPGRRQRPVTMEGDFGVSLLVLSAAVMRSDKKVVKAELDFVKTFFVRNFGEVKARQYILMLRDLLNQPYDLRAVCQQIRQYMDHASRTQLVHYLYGISMSDGQAHASELEQIRLITSWLGISEADHESSQAMFGKDELSAYKILEISKDATDEEVKKAYKKMAVKYHPDKVSHLGEDVQKAANEKFKEVNQAYESIKKQRGMN